MIKLKTLTLLPNGACPQEKNIDWKMTGHLSKWSALEEAIFRCDFLRHARKLSSFLVLTSVSCHSMES